MICLCELLCVAMILLCERCMNGLSMPDISSILKMAGSWCDCQTCVVFPGIVKGSLDEGPAMRVDLRFLHGAMRAVLSWFVLQKAPLL